jgi:hypothetical protein
VIRTAGRWVAAFARFWYGFIIGDDWTVAAAVAAGFIGTWLLLRANLTAWWLLPLVVVGIVAAGVRRDRARG